MITGNRWQAGELQNTDSHFIERNTNNGRIKIHPEAYRLKAAASPHYAAALEGIEIQKEQLDLPPQQII
jgi:dethiobiotin synthetase